MSPRVKATVAAVANIPRSRPTVLALHGFALGGAMYDELAELVDGDLVAPNLPGHAGRDAANTEWDSAIGEVIALVTELRPSVVLGYSMGGRLALGAALDQPEYFSRLVLTSASLGIADAGEREARRRRDCGVAALLEERGIEQFVDEWIKHPLIKGSEPLDDIRRRNSPAGLAGALRGMGQGVQPYLGDELSRLIVPTTWMAGGEDDAYASIARQAAETVGELIIVSGAGHNVVLDSVGVVAQAVNALL